MVPYLSPLCIISFSNLCTRHSSVDFIFSTLRNFCKSLLSSSMSLNISSTLPIQLASTCKFMIIFSLTFFSEGIGPLSTHPRTDEKATKHPSIPLITLPIINLWYKSHPINKSIRKSLIPSSKSA